MKISVELSWKIAQFITQIFRGQLDSPEQIALALDELSDGAWAEAEASVETERGGEA
jgi:hypothetical protein